MDARTFEVLSVIAALLVHSAALFYWGGKVTQSIRDHDRRIGRIENRVFPA